MGLRRLGESLLRSRTPPILSFLVPSVSSPSLLAAAASRPVYTALAGISIFKKSPAACLTQRYASSSAAKESSFTKSGSKDEGDTPQDSPSIPGAFSPIVDKLLHDTFYDKPSPGGTLRRTSEYIDPSRIGKSSSDLVADAYKSQIYGKQKSKPGSLFSNMEMPPSLSNSPPTSSTKISRDVANDYMYSKEPATRASLTIRSRPSVGRTVEINPDRGVDLGRGIKNLEITCALNNVRVDSAKQRFHERPGLKRKRLKSERWRKRFQIGFRHVVGKVKVMRRKGW